MKKKKGSSVFWWCLGILFLAFMGLYIAMESGYYESALHRKTAMTAEKIKEFEQDVADGKEIDLKDYLVDESVDYSNKATNLGVSVSNGVEKFMTQGIREMFEFVKKLVT